MAKGLDRKKASDNRSNEVLVNSLCLELDDDVSSEIFSILHARRDPDIINKALEMCKSADHTDRWIGAGIIAQKRSRRS